MRRHTLAAISMALALTGCGGSSVSMLNPFNWFGSDNAAKIAPLPSFNPAAETRLLWQAKVGDAGNQAFTPAVDVGAVFAASREGVLVRLDDGRETWRVQAGEPLSAGVGSDGRTVAVVTAKGEVLAYSAAGKELWRSKVSSDVLTPPLVAAGLVLVRSVDQRIHALDGGDGRRRWVYQRATPPLALRVPAMLAVSGDDVYAGFPGGKLVAISLDRGAARWEAAVATPRGATELERVVDIVGAPAVASREVCAVAYQGRIACFDRGSGTQLWARDMSSITGVAMDADNVYVADTAEAVHALQRGNGASVWKQTALAGRGLTAPAAMRRFVVLADREGYVHFLRRDDGALAARRESDGSRILLPPQPYGNGVLAQTRLGGLFALAAE